MIRRPAITFWLFLAAIFLGTPSVSCAWDFFPTSATLKSYYSPIFDPDAQKIRYIEREVSGVDWGPGWEHFSPPAWVNIRRDRFRLQEYDLESDSITTLRSFPASPLEGTTQRHYRGRLYGLPRVMLRYESESGHLEYEIGVSLMTQPSSTTYRVFRRWNNATHEIEEPESWQQEHTRMQGLNEDRLRGELELLTVPGREGLPCAIIMWDHAGGTQTVLVHSADFSERYPHGPPRELLERDSRKERIEHLRTMRADYQHFYQAHLAEGLRDNDARLAANKDMEQVGHYPKTPTLSARVVTEESLEPTLPVFDITRTEMESGIFNDIAAAVADPGSEIDYHGYRYITYTGYDTSRKLNEHLQSGNLSYAVRYLGKTYLLTIDRPQR